LADAGTEGKHMSTTQTVHALAWLAVRQERAPETHEALLDALFALRRAIWIPQLIPRLHFPDPLPPWQYERRRRLRGLDANPGQTRNPNGTWRAA
jgi:hypothetical protein